MGSWGITPFANDAALDWAWELDAAADWNVVDSLLRDVVMTINPDEDLVSAAYAAAELVALGGVDAVPGAEVPRSAIAFLERAGSPTATTVQLARAAMGVVSGSQSPLRDVWSADPEWMAETHRISVALESW